MKRRRVSSGLGDRRHQRAGLERHGRDAVEAMGFAQGEQALGLGGEGMDPGLGPGLAPVDAVVVPARADLRPLRREGGVHGVGERGVQLQREAAQFGVGSAQGLSLAVPIDDVRAVLGELEATGRVTRGTMAWTLGSSRQRMAAP